MAIKNSVNLGNGILVEGAYCRVENISLTKTEMYFNVRKYVDTSKPFFNEEYVSCSYLIDGDNPFIQAYQYIKTLDGYSNSEDC